VLDLSKRIYELSDGAYNPAIMPIINAWGFGPDESMKPDSATIDSLLAFSSYDLIQFDFEQVSKKDPRVQLDFSASAKGYAVDVIGHFLESKGISSYFVEIGGEVLVKGTNKQDKPWRIGIISPDSDLLTQHFYATANITNMAVATSANNFNYRVIDGVKYSHTIDPATGYPTQRSILSASIFTAECMEADALATASMVMGVEKAIKMIEGLEGVEAFFIYSGENGEMKSYMTAGIRPMINIIDKKTE
jgi:thiamine biosynthesis lipoprotein